MITSIDNYDLTDRNTFAMKVKCGMFMEYTSADDIPFVISSIRKDIGKFHIGAGSNLLFTGDFPGVVLHSAIKGIDIVSESAEEVIVHVGAGETMDDFIDWACQRGLWGVENLSGIPGEVGASAVQNVGAYGTEACDAIVRVHAFDEVEHDFVTFDNADCQFAYRNSLFKHPDEQKRYIIHAVDYRLTPIYSPNLSYPALTSHFGDGQTDNLTPADIRKAVISIRNTKLPNPATIPSAGSFFKNPVIPAERFHELCANNPGVNVPNYKVDGGYKIPAAWLIDQCGWKGYDDGNVAVWHLQPLVIVNPDREATPADVIALEQKIILSVKERFGITLSPEVEHI